MHQASQALQQDPMAYVNMQCMYLVIASLTVAPALPGFPVGPANPLGPYVRKKHYSYTMYKHIIILRLTLIPGAPCSPLGPSAPLNP